jgi:hypothetical protein
MRDVMSRLPVIERLVTVLNRSEPRRDDAGREEPVEGGYGLDAIGARYSSGTREQVSDCCQDGEMLVEKILLLLCVACSRVHKLLPLLGRSWRHC